MEHNNGMPLVSLTISHHQDHNQIPKTFYLLYLNKTIAFDLLSPWSHSPSFLPVFQPLNQPEAGFRFQVLR